MNMDRNSTIFVRSYNYLSRTTSFEPYRMGIKSRTDQTGRLSKYITEHSVDFYNGPR